MSVLYHLTFLPPKMPECVAEYQEVNTLVQHFGGQIIYLNPNQNSPLYIPRLLFGFQKLKEIRQLEQDTTLHHIYNADAFPFPVLKYLKRPVIYTISGGIGQKRPPLRFLNALAAVTVSDERSLRRLKDWGSTNCIAVRPGIDTRRFSYTPTPLQRDLYLMVGSAPWTLTQFQTKGVDALLEAARRRSTLHLIFLWRGVLADNMEQRIRDLNLKDQVQIIKQRTEVNDVLAQVHASITLATTPGIVKAYPHSLLESLAAGKPVLVSQAIPMADYVEQTQCGQVVKTVTPEAILDALDSLTSHYTTLQENAHQAGKRDFSLDNVINSFGAAYRHVLEHKS